MWGEAWDMDLAEGSETEDASGAKRMYRTLVPDQGAKVSFISAFRCKVFISAQATAVATLQCSDG